MKIYNTLPKNGNWQFDLLPCIGILRVDYTTDEDWMVDQSIETINKYYSITFQWLFWSLNWQINK